MNSETFTKLNKLSSEARYPGDILLQNQLLKIKEINDYIKNTKKNFKTSSDHRYQELLCHSLKITKKTSPYIFKGISKCANTLGIDIGNVEVFICASREINAWCARNGEKILIGLNSGLIDCLDFDELCFVIGHELGHAFYEHHKLPAYGICQSINIGSSRLLKLMSWSRQSEISADRAGLLCSNIDATISSLIKLSTGGLSDPVVNVDLDEFEKQLDDIDKFIDKNSDLMYTTHPLNPFRIRAIFEFSKIDQLNSMKNKLTIDDVNKQIDEIVEKMNPSKIKKKKTSASKDEGNNFHPIDAYTAFASYYVLSADGIDSGGKELKSLEEIVGKTLTDIAEDAAENAFKQAQDIRASKLSKINKAVKCQTLEKIIAVSRADGEITKKERDHLGQICDDLGIDQSFIENILKFLD